MNKLLIIGIVTIIGFILSKIIVYIFDKICYYVLDKCIDIKNERIQNYISKILGV